MAQNVYSKVLASKSQIPSGGWSQLATVPSGFVWVVRHVSAWNTTAAPTGLGSILLAGDDLVPMWGVGYPESRSGHWFGNTIHQALGSGGTLWVNPEEPFWEIRVSGFQLTLP